MKLLPWQGAAVAQEKLWPTKGCHVIERRDAEILRLVGLSDLTLPPVPQKLPLSSPCDVLWQDWSGGHMTVMNIR